MKLLFESWRKYSKPPTAVPFLSLLKEHDSKKMSDRQLFLEWKKQTTAELEQLNEINWEKEAELTADPDYKPPQERPGMLAKGWEKVNDFLLKKSVELVELSKRSLTATLKATVWLNKMVEKFKQKHPILYAIIKWVLIAVVIAALLHLISGAAQAKIKTADGKILSDTEWEMTRGFISEWADSKPLGDVQTMLDSGRAIELIDELHHSANVQELPDFKEKFSSIARIATENITKLVEEYRSLPVDSEEKAELGQTLARWWNVGKSLKVSNL